MNVPTMLSSFYFLQNNSEVGWAVKILYAPTSSDELESSSQSSE